MLTYIQYEFLDSLVVERLKNTECLVDLKSFKNVRNSNLSNYLMLGAADEEDTSNKAAVYILRTSVKTRELLQDKFDIYLRRDVILLYFALRPGLISTPITENLNMLEDLYKLISTMPQFQNSEINNMRYQLICKFANKYQISREEAIAWIEHYSTYVKELQSRIDILRQGKKDKQVFQDLHKQVQDTSGAVELYLFCSNEHDIVENIKTKLNFLYPFGQIAYWKFIFPIIAEAIELISGEFIYLFAAEPEAYTDQEKTLVEYYQDRLNFIASDKYVTLKPVFDFGCIFMWQSVVDAQQFDNDFLKELKYHEDSQELFV